MFNKITLVGRLTKDPELRYTPANATAVATFTLAVDRPFKNQAGEKETDFINIVVWKKQAENCTQYLGKGSKALVDGRLQVRTYTDRDDNKRWITEVVAERVVFLDNKKQSQQQGQDQGGQAPWDAGDGANISEDDVPF